MTFRTIALLLASFAALPLHGALSWESTVYKEQASATSVATVAKFRFTNKGKDSVQISSLKSSCGCTTAELEKRLYAPGEGGTITAEFTYGDRVGKQHKVITITSQDGEATHNTMLEIFVDIPESINVSPRIQFWKQGEALEGRPIVIKMAEGFPGTPISARMFDKDSKFRLGEITMTAPGEYVLEAVPLTTDKTMTEAGELLFEVEGKEHRKLIFYLSVR